MITINNLTFSYSKKVTFIENMNFTIEKGEIFGLLGPSGAGKSTIQKILTGNIRNYQGTVKVLNNEARNYSNDFYKNIGVQFEVPNLYSKYTALENLNYFSSLYNVDILNPVQLLEQVGLGKDINKNVKDFSKGMKTRLNFIRSILHKPQILFLDEPTSGLDPINAKIIKDIIRSLKEKRTTIILTTHNMHDVQELCDRVAFINQGQILAVDYLNNLISKSINNDVSYSYEENERVQEVQTILKDLDTEEFRKIISEKRLTSIHSKEITLNDLFISLAGRSLHESN